MPRKKKIPPLPKVVGRFTENSEVVEIVEIDEHTESFGKGAYAKVRRLKNFNIALERFADEYFWGNKKRKLKQLVYNPRKTSALANELVTLGIELQDRSLRDLAVEIRKQIKALDNALEKK